MSSIIPPRPEGRPRQRSLAQITGVDAAEANLPYPVVDTNQDVPKGMCITVAFAEGHHNPIVSDMLRQARAYWRVVARLREQTLAGDRLASFKLRRILNLPEVPELRLGYVRIGHAGYGPGKGKLQDRLLTRVLTHKEFIETAVIHPDVLYLVRGFGIDRGSDAFASVCKRGLVKFTQECAEILGFDPECMREVRINHAWNEQTEEFDSFVAKLPVDDMGVPFLLVPRELVASAPILTAAKYFGDHYGGDDGEESSRGVRTPPKSPRPSGGATKRKRSQGKDAALTDADQHPTRLRDWAKERLKAAQPRREYRRPRGR